MGCRIACRIFLGGILLARILLFPALVPVFAQTPAAAIEEAVAPELYKAETIVTGVEEPQRLVGFREGLEEIAVKVTGRPDALTSGPVQRMLENPTAFIANYTYEDRNKHLKKNDEQGTRDRPYFLRMTADREKINAVLGEAGLTIWSGRPELQISVTVLDGRGLKYIADESAPLNPPALQLPLSGKAGGSIHVAYTRWDGYEQRETLKSIGRRRGLLMHFPKAGLIASAVASGDFNAASGNANAVRDRFYAMPDTSPGGVMRYEAALIFAEDQWHVRIYARRLPDKDPELSRCFMFKRKTDAFAQALEAGIDALTEWLRSPDQSTVRCADAPAIDAFD